jgi:hypothetical protein
LTDYQPFLLRCTPVNRATRRHSSENFDSLFHATAAISIISFQTIDLKRFKIAVRSGLLQSGTNRRVALNSREQRQRF